MRSAQLRMVWMPVLLAAVVWVLTAASGPASAHVHHGSDGTTVDWYPSDCCHGGDCHPVSTIRAFGDGLVVTTDDGATLFISPRKTRRQSLDNRWHICFDPSEDAEIRCVFEPPNS